MTTIQRYEIKIGRDRFGGTALERQKVDGLFGHAIFCNGADVTALESRNADLVAENERLRSEHRFHGSHEAVDAFWKVWNEVGEPHKHGVYESTWMAFRAVIRAREGTEQGQLYGERVKGLVETLTGPVHYELSKQFGSTDHSNWPMRPQIAWDRIQQAIKALEGE